MCEPTTIMMAVAAVAGAYGAHQSSQAAKAQSTFAARQAEYNSQIAEYQRESALQQGGAEAIKAQREAQRLRGAQVARLAGNGLDISSGSALALLDDTDFFGQQDAYQIRNNAARAAWGHQVEGASFSASAQMHQSSANAEKPWLAAGTSLLSSAGQFAGSSAGQNATGRFKASRSLDKTMNTSGLW